MAKVLTKYMASYNVGETQQPTNATIAHKEQTLPFDKAKVVGMPLGVEFGWMSAFLRYENYTFIGQLDTDGHIFTLRKRSRALMSLIGLFTSSFPNCQLKQHLDLNYMLPEQLQIPCLERFTVWSSAGEIYLVTTAQHVSQIQSIIFSQLSAGRQELRV
jgi:hypothetical protein